MVHWAPCPDPDKLHSSFVWGQKSEGARLLARQGNRKNIIKCAKSPPLHNSITPTLHNSITPPPLNSSTPQKTFRHTGIDSVERKCYAVRTSFKREKLALADLLRQGIECYLPMLHEVKRYEHKYREVGLPLNAIGYSMIMNIDPAHLRRVK